jgi:ribosomal protein S18 acetylase RimI-like enzyme
MTDVRVAGADEHEAVLDALMLAFASDPCLRYLLSTPQALLAGFRPFATGMGGASLAAGTAWLAADADAAAMWLPPGVESDREAMFAVAGQWIRPERAETIGAVGEAMAGYHPEEPHWYLAMIGVDPSRQGRGLGSAVLKESLRRVDESGLPAYLESSNPKNVPLYERFGFEVMGHVAPGDFPGLHPMWRPARR